MRWQLPRSMRHSTSTRFPLPASGRRREVAGVRSPALDDPAFWAGDPEADLARLRAEAPVHWYEPGKFWALTRHADVLTVSRDPAGFCSSGGVLMNDRERNVV